MNPLRTLVATQLPSEGSVVPDDPITRHIVLKVFRGPAPPVRPLSPPRGDSRRANGPIRGAGRDRGAGRGTTRRSASLTSNNRGEGAVRRESVLVQHYHTPRAPGIRSRYTTSDTLSRIYPGPCQWLRSLGQTPLFLTGQYTHTLSPGVNARPRQRVS